MGAPHMRPPFRLQLPVEAARLMSEVKTRLSSPGAALVGTVMRRHVELTVRERHFWSPQLSVDVLEVDGKTVLRGRFGPHPHVWTLVMGIYGLLLMTALFATVFGLSQWNLGWRPWAFWGLVPSVVGAVLLYLSSLAGQRAAYPQMQALEAFFRDCVARASDAPSQPRGSGVAEAVVIEPEPAI